MADKNIKPLDKLEPNANDEKRTFVEKEKLQLELLSVKEFTEKLHQTNNNLELQLQDKQKEIAELKHKFEQLSNTITNQNSNSSAIEARYMELLNQNAQITKELELATRRLNNSFTSAELADYLNNAIQAFNYQMEQASDNVIYKINSLDIDMKSHIVKKNDELAFVTSSESGENAMSTIHISIVTVPK